MNIKQISKKKIIGTSFLINLIIVSLSVMLVLSQTSTTFTISSGIYPQASYTIWREGSNYFSKNVYGVVVSQGTNASLVIQTTVNLINHDGILTEGGGSICFLPEHYELDHAINISQKRGLEIFGLTVSRYGTNFGTVFSLNDGADTHIILCNNTSADYFFGITLENFQIYGNKANQNISNIHGIFFINTFEIYIKNVVIQRVNGDGIRLDSCEVGEISDCIIDRPDGACITLISNDYVIKRNNVEKAGTHAIYVGGSENYIGHNIIADSGNNNVTGSGIYLDTDVHRNTLNDNIIARSFTSGINFHGAENNTAEGNNIYDGLQHGIYLNGDYNILGLNHLENNAYWGISEVSADYNTIALCHAFDNGYGGISVTGANTHVNLCWNSTNWIA